jgi:hypothetical protein
LISFSGCNEEEHFGCILSFKYFIEIFQDFERLHVKTFLVVSLIIFRSIAIVAVCTLERCCVSSSSALSIIKHEIKILCHQLLIVGMELLIYKFLRF